MIPEVYNPFEEINFTECVEEAISSQCWLYTSDLIQLYFVG